MNPWLDFMRELNSFQQTLSPAKRTPIQSESNSEQSDCESSDNDVSESMEVPDMKGIKSMEFN